MASPRAGAPFSGAIVARAAGADLYENWTDVSGFLACDPRIVDNPVPIRALSYKELRELSYMGANVLHSESIFPVREADIPIRIKNTFRPEDEGTEIVPTSRYTYSGRRVTGIAGKKNFTVIFLEKSLMNTEIGFTYRALGVFLKHNISFEHIPTGIDTMSFVIDGAELKNGALDTLCDEIRDAVQPDSLRVISDIALIAVVGHGMARSVGTSARLFEAIARAGVNVRAANISLGGWYRPSEMEGSAYDYKIKELSEADIVVCMAAGNDRENIDDPAGYPGQRFYPASFRYENTIAVGALMRNADGTLAPDTPGSGGLGYSNYSASGEWVDIFAPGTAILSTCRKVDLLGDASDPSGYKAMDGTSMAAPHATGAAALLASLMPEKSAAEIKKMILDGADGSIAKDGYSRCGALDLYGAWKQGAYAEEVEPGEPGGVDGAVAMLADIGLTKAEVSGIFEGSELEEIDNMLYLDAEITGKAVENLRADKAVKDVALFPVFAANSAELADNPLGAVAFAVSGEAFGKGNTLADVAICKLFPDGSALEYKEASASPGDGTFTVTEADGSALSGPFDADKKYIITLFIEDNGPYDLDKDTGSIVDPTAIVSFKKAETHGGSGGGCSAVSGTAELLALIGLPLIAGRKK